MGRVIFVKEVNRWPPLLTANLHWREGMKWLGWEGWEVCPVCPAHLPLQLRGEGKSIRGVICSSETWCGTCAAHLVGTVCIESHRLDLPLWHTHWLPRLPEPASPWTCKYKSTVSTKRPFYIIKNELWNLNLWELSWYDILTHLAIKSLELEMKGKNGQGLLQTKRETFTESHRLFHRECLSLPS